MTYLMNGSSFFSFPFVFLVGVLLIASIKDILSYKVPNWVTLPTAIIGIIWHASARGSEGFFYSLEGVVVGFALMIFFYLTGGSGAGDVKLMAAVGGFLGPKGILIAWICTSFVGGIYALILLAIKGHLTKTFKRYGAFLKTFIYTKKIIYTPPSEREKQFKICFGLATAIGTGVYLFFGMLKVL
jgi:prepilin peptidase CpaA